ncbi:MAG: glycogen/starch/alpha-glucan family phosphorylase, partial [Erysipelotrichaceae bacterium]|nr:glycogen/starch/alpha-glucan family phosphorylase [Erysipelotrichaceae bacterium]
SYVKAHLRKYGTIHNIHEKLVFQLNDTHPAMAIAEMMRVLLDEFYLEWDEAWNITTNMMAYTNHTILSEALEKWPVDYIRTLLPRIYMIIEEINRRFCIFARSKNVVEHRIHKMMIIHDGQVHMANLAIIGSYSVNGVAALHTKILKEQEMREFYDLYPEKFNNKTNGITHRRWLAYCNEELYEFLNRYCKGDVVENIELLSNLKEVIDDDKVVDEFIQVKNAKKQYMVEYIKEKNDIDVDVNSIFDVQVKRLHAYKRQLLNCLHIIYLYQKLKNDKNFKIYPRTFIFGAKAAPSYVFAKNVIELINCMACKINNDKDVNKYIKVVFLENYDVSLAEKLIPAADVSEQISLAGKEASGTGNMKFMMNGALTVGTLDGANVEIADLVGEDNIFIFGLKAEEVKKIKEYGEYSSLNVYATNEDIRNAINSLMDGTWHENKNEFRTIVDDLLYKNDEYLLLEDFTSYVKTQQLVEQEYQDRRKWARKCLINIASSAFFSSDRTIKQYVEDIWKLDNVD